MPAAISLATFTLAIGPLQLVGLMLLIVAALVGGLAAWHCGSGEWPAWLDLGEFRLSNRAIEIGCAAMLVLAIVTHTAAVWAGQNPQTPAVDSPRVTAALIQQFVSDAQVQRVELPEPARFTLP